MYNGKIVVLNGKITKSLTFTSFLGILGAAFRYLEVWKRFIFAGSFRKDKILVRSRNQTGSELADFLRFERPLPLMGLCYIFPQELLETSEIAIRKPSAGDDREGRGGGILFVFFRRVKGVERLIKGGFF